MNLSTRSTCDECGNPAILTCGDAFLCERCDREINGEVENSNSNPSASRPDVAPVAESSPRFHAAGATSSISTQLQVDATNSPVTMQLTLPGDTLAAPTARKPGAALSFEAEVSALEAIWARDEACMFDILQIDGAIGLRGVHDA